jgi:hypothetical protein
MVARPYHSDPGLNHNILDEFQVLGYPVLSMRSIPKDPVWLERFFKADLEKGLVKTVLDITDVWPENYSANSAQKVWAAKFASRHPNVAVVDLSSFKCGHDAPTYGLVDGMIGAAGTPYQALHDIDANKPGGSIKIRVKTYSHSLKLYQERLSDLAKQKNTLKYRIDLKRIELLKMKKEQLEAQHRPDPALALQIEQLMQRVKEYEHTDLQTAAQKATAEAKAAGLVKLGVKRPGVDQVARISSDSRGG